MVICFVIEHGAHRKDGEDILEGEAEVGTYAWTVLLDSDYIEDQGGNNFIIKGRDVHLLFADLTHELPV